MSPTFMKEMSTNPLCAHTHTHSCRLPNQTLLTQREDLWQVGDEPPQVTTTTRTHRSDYRDRSVF